MTKSTRFVGLWLLVSLTMASCGGLNNSASEPTTTSPPPSTEAKDGDRPKGFADQEENKALTPPEKTVTSPSSADGGNAAEEEAIPVPSAAPPVVRSATQNVPSVDPIRKDAASSANYETPNISGTIVPYLMANKTMVGACQDIRFDPELTKVSSNAFRISENRYFVKFTCGATAYQPLQEYYIYERTNDVPLITPLALTYFYTDLDSNLIEETERTMAGYDEYAPETQTISIFTKGRGLGDCGTLGFYRLEGSQLVLERFLAKDECDGNYVEPINYPQLYP